MPEPRNPRPLLVTFHCGVFFLYLSVFLMSVSNRNIQPHFEQMGPTFIRDMMVFMGICFVGYLGLWNLRRFGILLLLAVSGPFIWYGIHMEVGRAIFIHFLPLIAAITCLPLWPILGKP